MSRDLEGASYKCDTRGNCQLYECKDFKRVLKKCTYEEGVQCLFSAESWNAVANECAANGCDADKDCGLPNAITLITRIGEELRNISVLQTPPLFLTSQTPHSFSSQLTSSQPLPSTTSTWLSAADRS